MDTALIVRIVELALKGVNGAVHRDREREERIVGEDYQELELLGGLLSGGVIAHIRTVAD